MDLKFKPVEETLHQVMQDIEGDKDIKNHFMVIAERNFFNASYTAPNNDYKWKELEQSSNNDTVSENACISFLENDLSTCSWFVHLTFWIFLMASASLAASLFTICPLLVR